MEEANIKDKIFSVSEFISLLNIGLRRSKVKIIGEISENSFGPTGHVYFTLKDEGDKSVINCIIWKSRYNIFGVELKEGLKIIASGYPEVYSKTGRLSFISETIELAGQGELKKEYERLKKKLEEEGMFEEARKRPIPQYIHKIGVITSMKGAVIADFSSNLKKFGFKVKIIDSRVEGQAAVADLLLSIKTFKKQDIDVLVIMRGGGSLESMQAFNNEMLVREIVNFPCPVIMGIGHDKDQPLAVLAADKSVSTPTAVANFINEPWMGAIFFLKEHERYIVGSYERVLAEADEAIRQTIKASLLGFKYLLTRARQKIEQAERIINFNNPERQLKLGYSIAACRGKIIRTVENVKIGEQIDIKVIDGIIISKVNRINPAPFFKAMV